MYWCSIPNSSSRINLSVTHTHILCDGAHIAFAFVCLCARGEEKNKKQPIIIWFSANFTFDVCVKVNNFLLQKIAFASIKTSFLRLKMCAKLF